MSEAVRRAVLGDLADIVMGQSPDSASVNSSGEGLPFLQGCAEFGARSPEAKVHCAHPLRVAKAGSILISVRAPVGTLNRADRDYCIGRGLGAVLPKEGAVDPGFLFEAIRQGTAHLQRRSQGSTFLAISSVDLRSMPMSLPTLREQAVHGAILSAFDQAIQYTEAMITKLQIVKAGMMHDLLTRGIMPNGELRSSREEAPRLYKESPLGWIPRGWVIDSIGNLFRRRVERGRVGLPIMSVTMHEGLVNRDSVERRVDTNLSPEQHLLVKKNDIAYNMMRMWQGVLGRAEYDCLVSPAYVVVQPGARIDSEFAQYLLSWPRTIADFKRLSYGVVADRLRLYAKELKRVVLAVPEHIEEQKRIAVRLAAIIAKAAALGAQVTGLRNIKSGLAADLLTGRVCVPESMLREAAAR